jgi:hypothetical protein
MINKVINGLSLLGELVKSPIAWILSIISNDRIISRPTKLPFFISIHFSMQIKAAPSFMPGFDMFNDSFEELIVVELKSPLYFECILLSHVLRIRNTK